MYDSERSNVKAYVGLALVGLLVLLGVITFFSAMRSVDTGNIGVVTQYGKVTGRELEEGLAWIAPWGVNSVTEYSIKTQKEEQSATAATRDLQDVTAKVVLNYRLERGKVSSIHQEVGPKYKDVLMNNAIQSSFKANTAKYTALELVSERGAVESKVLVELQKRLSGRGIVVENVALIDLTYSKEFTQAIEQRQVAEQNAKRAEFNLQQARLDAQSQDVQAKTLTDNYLQLKAIEKWNGKLPQAVGGNGTLFNIPIK